ncbi:L-rhamnose-binding lectin ELEL-1-like [Saccostrea cucullata]|uniref:L-rhamnose-binding lectin ELEL-1-like n=1 Tax=Saccostrea cuccullata TaxID=36930 RepID=UPI002ED4F071
MYLSIFGGQKMLYFQAAAVLLLSSAFRHVETSDQSFALCDGQKGFIRCTKGAKIQILSANYGRTDERVCPSGKINTRTCHLKSSEIKTKWNCNGYRTCHLQADAQQFGDPCQNSSKYLEVKYRCVKDQTLFQKIN